jgi:DNA-binding transcriptional LysR family regulator
MNFQHLRHFLVTADTGNMLKAAEALNIGQSGLSRSIGALENLLGLPLFERGAKGVTLTAFGQRFYPRARFMLNEYNASMDELKTFQNLGGGSARIGVNNLFVHVLIPTVIAELTRRWPGIHVDLVSSSYTALIADLTNGNVDIAFSPYTPAGRHDQLEYEDLFTIRPRVFARADHPLRHSPDADLAAFAAAQWCLITGSLAQASFEGIFTSAGIEPPQITMRCSSVALLAGVVAQSDMLTLLPEQFAQPEEIGIAPLHGDLGFGLATAALIRRRGSFDSPIADRLSRLVRREVAARGLAGPVPGWD